MLQNLPYFGNTKTHVVFFVFHFVLPFPPLMNALVYGDIDQGIYYALGKNKVTRNEIQKKQLWVFVI